MRLPSSIPPIAQSTFLLSKRLSTLRLVLLASASIIVLAALLVRMSATPDVPVSAIPNGSADPATVESAASEAAPRSDYGLERPLVGRFPVSPAPVPSPTAPQPIDEPVAVALGPRGASPSATPAQVRAIAATPAPTPIPAAAPPPPPPSTAQPTPVPPPPAPAPVAPPPPTGPPSSCGAIAEPPAGWTRRTQSTFDEATPLGSWPGPIAAQSWKNRAPGPDSSGRGTYNSSRTISEHSGMLDVWIHSEGSTRYVAAPVSKLGGTLGARISVCMRTDAIPGYKMAYLLWPTEGQGNTLGEIDFPEARLVQATAYAFMHYAPKPATDPKQDAYDSGAPLQQWHTYTIEWNPRAAQPYVTFLVDGRVIGHSTQHVPTVPMFYVMQMETLIGDALPAPAQGHVLIDWVTIDVP